MPTSLPSKLDYLDIASRDKNCEFQQFGIYSEHLFVHFRPNLWEHQHQMYLNKDMLGHWNLVRYKMNHKNHQILKILFLIHWKVLFKPPWPGRSIKYTERTTDPHARIIAKMCFQINAGTIALLANQRAQKFNWKPRLEELHIELVDGNIVFSFSIFLTSTQFSPNLFPSFHS